MVRYCSSSALAHDDFVIAREIGFYLGRSRRVAALGVVEGEGEGVGVERVKACHCWWMVGGAGDGGARVVVLVL